MLGYLPLRRGTLTLSELSELARPETKNAMLRRASADMRFTAPAARC